MINRKYGKSLGDIIGIKQDFFNQNKEMLAMADRIAKVFAAQPKRKTCKICGEEINAEPLFKSHDINYHLCPVCNHLNGEFEDTDIFAYQVYIQDNYAGNYSAQDQENYRKRMEAIYVPKAQFLFESLEKDGVSKEEIKLLDNGAGSGYFVRAVNQLGGEAKGVEISPEQVVFANQMAGKEILTQKNADEIVPFLGKAQCNVVSAIGVLEHIVNLEDTLMAIKENENIKYMYLSVPLFSFSCAFEAAHQSCYNRHLGGTHTHLFTDESLQFMAEKMGFSVNSTWKFGSDMMDLYRFICVSMEQNGNGRLKEYFSNKFLPLIDDMQNIVDKSEFASEVHMLLKRK